MFGKIIKSCINSGRKIRGSPKPWLNNDREILGLPKFVFRCFASKGKVIEPGFNFGRPMFGPHYGIFDAPIQADGLPLYVNWEKVPGFLCPPFDQGPFGICYVCAPLSAMSGLNFLATYDTTRESVQLSLQHVLDCGTINAGSMHGGFVKKVLDFAVRNGGILTEDIYPFTGKLGLCKKKKGMGVSIDSWMKVKPNCELSLRYVLAHQPAIINIKMTDWIEVDGLLVQDVKYARGTIRGPSYNKNRPNHSAVLFGYGKNPSAEPIWEGINSYGSCWGVDGKFQIARSTDRAGGELGVLRNPITPLKYSDKNNFVVAQCESCPRCYKVWKRLP